MSEEEFVELTIKIPKPIMNFFEAYWKFVGYDDQTAQEYLAKRLGEYSKELIGSMVMNEIQDDAEILIETYGLEPYRDVMDFPTKKRAEAK